MKGALPWILCAVGAIAACTGSTGPQGPAGDSVRGDDGLPGEQGDPPAGSIRAIQPDQLYLGRTLDVSLEGFGTKWTDDAVVSFDPSSAPGDEDIVVLDVRRASPTALVATVSVSDEALQGIRDVTVTSGDEVARLEGGLRIIQPLTMLLFPQVEQIPQGGLAAPLVRMNDPLTPFHPVDNLSGIPGGAQFPVVVLEPYWGGAFVAIDVFAETGPATLHISSAGGAGLQRVASVAPGAIDVVARTPDLLSDDYVSVVFDDYGTRLYEVEVSPRQALQVSTGVDTTAADFTVHFLTPSGRWEHLLREKIHFAQFGIAPETYMYAPTAGSVFLLVRPFGLNLGYEVTLDIQRRDVFPIPISAPTTIARPTLAAPNMDVFEIDADAGDVITATIGDGATDVCAPAGAINAEIWVVDAAGNTVPVRRARPTSLCPRLELEISETGTYSLVIAPHTRQPNELLEGDSLCAPVNACAFDYTLTVVVE